MAWAIVQQRIQDPPARHVLLVLAQTASPEGEDAWRSVQRLAEETGLSERTVQMKLQHLLAVGLIRQGDQAVVAVKIKRADRRPTVYDLDIRAEELIAAGLVNRKPSRGEYAAPGKVVDNAVDQGSSRGEGNAPRESERGAADNATGCSSLQERGAGAAPTPKALLQELSKREENSRSPTGSRLPLDWEPSAEDRQFAATERPDLNVDAEAAKFRDYWRSIPGQKGCSADWAATWRNWIRRADAPKGPCPSPPPASTPSAPQRDWREPSETPLQTEIAHIRHQHSLGAFGEDTAEAARERDRRIAQAHRKYAPDVVTEGART